MNKNINAFILSVSAYILCIVSLLLSGNKDLIIPFMCVYVSLPFYAQFVKND